MKRDFCPILVVPAVSYDGGIRFLHHLDMIEIGPESAEMVWKVLFYCNGYNSVEDIINLSDMEEEEVVSIIEFLDDSELIVDSREQFVHFHCMSSYPPAFGRRLTQDEIRVYSNSDRKPVKDGKAFTPESLMAVSSAMWSIRENRRSVRNFSTEKLLSDEFLLALCNFAYSIPDHAVPSGGALYPLRIYLILEKQHGRLPPGYYEFDAEKNRLVLFDERVDIEQLKYCFNQEQSPFNSSVQIIIAADFKRQTYKYCDRGYRLALIEVGHVAQNISLFCAEHGAGSCEMGGVQDNALMQELGLVDDEIYPILAIPIGYPEKEEKGLDKIRFVEGNTGDDKPVQGLWSHSFGNDSSFFGVTSSYVDENSSLQYAGATSPAYADAAFKAVIEGYERKRSGVVRVDYEGPASNCPGKWISPDALFPLTTEQIMSCGLVEFNESLPITWVRGVTAEGKDCYVPTDLVYYGQKDHANRLYYGHSSGIAAYSNVEEAERRALTELIERDAIMRNWYSHEAPKILSKDLLPVHAAKRKEYWYKKDRREVYFLELPSDYGTVILTAIFGKSYPFFVCGAAATLSTSREETDVAINKALQEAEYNLLLTLRDGEEKEVNVKDVSTPTDHGAYYYSEEHATKLTWLLEGEEISNFTLSESVDFDTLKKRLETITVDMSETDSTIKIVRVLSPKLVPINFGYNTAHYSHPELRNVAKELWYTPHYFA